MNEKYKEYTETINDDGSKTIKIVEEVEVNKGKPKVDYTTIEVHNQDGSFTREYVRPNYHIKYHYNTNGRYYLIDHLDGWKYYFNDNGEKHRTDGYAIEFTDSNGIKSGSIYINGFECHNSFESSIISTDYKTFINNITFNKYEGDIKYHIKFDYTGLITGIDYIFSENCIISDKMDNPAHALRICSNQRNQLYKYFYTKISREITKSTNLFCEDMENLFAAHNNQVGFTRLNTPTDFVYVDDYIYALIKDSNINPDYDCYVKNSISLVDIFSTFQDAAGNMNVLKDIMSGKYSIEQFKIT